MENEIRGFLCDIETREENNVGIIEGLPVVFNSRADLGWYDEVIKPEALIDCDLRDVRLCLNHDTSYVYARSRNNNENSSMQLFVDDEGLRFRASLDLESPKAKDYYIAIVRGDMDKMSFMFRVDRDEWEDIDSDHPTRFITGISRIFEISMVTFPAYDSTSIQAASEPDEALDSVRQSLESAKAEARAIERKKQKIRILSEV